MIELGIFSLAGRFANRKMRDRASSRSRSASGKDGYLRKSEHQENVTFDEDFD
jgi:hypothetical protein